MSPAKDRIGDLGPRTPSRPTRKRRPGLEVLEPRHLLTAVYYPSTRLLQVTGSDINDHVRIETVGTSTRVVVNGLAKEFPTSDLVDVEFIGGGGRDSLELNHTRADESMRFLSWKQTETKDRESFIETNIEVSLAGQVLHSIKYDDVESIEIHAGNFADLFEIDYLPFDVTLELLGGDGDDDFIVGKYDFVSSEQPDVDPTADWTENVIGNLLVNGQGGNDSLTIDDTQDDVGDNFYIVESHRIRKGDYELRGGFIRRTIVHEQIESAALTTAAELANDVFVNSFDGALRIFADGEDVVTIGDGTLEPITGSVLVTGGAFFSPHSGIPETIVNDQADTGDDPYRFQTDPSGFGNVLIKHQSSGQLAISRGNRGLNQKPLTLLANAGNNEILIFDRFFSEEVVIDAGDGDDAIRVLGGVSGEYRIAGNLGNDRIELNYSDTSGGIALTVDDRQISAPGLQIEIDSGIEQFEFQGTRYFDTIDVLATNPSIEYTVMSNGGEDRVEVGDGRFDSNIRGILNVIDDRRDPGRLIIDNRDSPQWLSTDFHYFSTERRGGLLEGTLARVEKLGGIKSSPPKLFFRGQDLVLFEASDSSGEIVVGSTISGTDYRIDGNGGRDSLRVHTSQLRSHLTFHGGQPTSEPGDALHLVGDGSGRGEYATSGTITVDQRNITLTGLESVQVENFDSFVLQTQWSQDILKLTPGAVEGWSVVSGFTGNRPIAFEPLAFRGVREFEIDMATNDLVAQTYGSILYPPIPNDRVELEPNALNANGLEVLRIVSGVSFGSDLVVDRSLLGELPIGSRLELESDLGQLTHIVYGSPDLAQFNLRADQAFTGVFQDETGDPLYIVDGQNVGRVILPDVQNRISVDAEGAQLNVSEANGRRILSGDDRTSVEYAFDEFTKFERPELIGTGIVLDGPVQVFAVTSTSDSGPGSLRSAIETVNAWTGSEAAIISFSIASDDPGFVDIDSTLDGGDAAADVFVISPQTALPPIRRPNVVINGQSQHNRTGDTNPFGPEIVLSGGDLNVVGLELESGSNVVHGMVLNGFLRALIRIESDSNRITGTYLGTDATGTAKARDVGNSSEVEGIYLDSASGNVIGGDAAGMGNLISGKRQGIWIVGGSENLVQGNRIGTNAGGTATLDNLRGVLISDSSRNRVVNNQIAGSLEGIGIRGVESTDTVVQGNWIGLDVSGSEALPGQRYGIRIVDAPRTLVGGLSESDRNVVSGGWYGVVVQGTLSTETRIQGNYVGTDVTGTHAVGNGTGVWLLSGAAHNLVGGSEPGASNLLSGNVQNVFIDGGATGNRVQGNTIGLDVTQSIGISTEGGGVTIAFGAKGNFVGTDGDGIADDLEGNVISGHQFHGVFIWRGATENVVAGNLIGTDPTGKYAIGNSTGVEIQEADRNRIGTNGDGVSDDLERNVIAGSRVYGVAILAPPWEGTGADENIVAGNLIGTDISGKIPIGNARAGIGLRYTNPGNGQPLTPPDGNRIGGEKPVERNVIAASGGDGIEISYATNTWIVNNFIGIDASGHGALPNARHGIHAIDEVGSVTIGAIDSPPNVIAFNAGAGVAVKTTSSEIEIRGNSIYANGGLGIDLGSSGVTPNDEGDVDVGANQLVNYPELRSVAVNSDRTRVRGQYNGLSGYPATLDFYASSEADPSGHGEGARWIGAFVLDHSGNAEFDAILDALLPSERYVTATATVLNSTSEFSVAIGFDATAPQSRINSKQLPSTADQLQFTVSALVVDPEVVGQATSGVASVEFWVSVDGGAFQQFVIVDSAPYQSDFTAESNHTYSFRSVATDLAGNVESKKLAAEATIYVPDLTAPTSRVDRVDRSTATFMVEYSASDSGGSGLVSVDVIVEVDGGKPQLVATARLKEAKRHSGSVEFQAIADDQPHHYRFYTVALDRHGNRETRPQDPDKDVAFTAAYPAPAGLELIGFDVQRGATQRSYVRYVDAVFNTNQGLDEILATLDDGDSTNDRVRLTKFDLNGNSGKAFSLAAGIVKRTNQGIELDFGSSGVGGNRNSAAGDGYYQLQLDLDGDGELETTRSFYRLFGDTNGDRRVDAADLSVIASAFGSKGPGLDGDINGDGVVNILDRLYASRQVGRFVAEHLPLDD